MFYRLKFDTAVSRMLGVIGTSSLGGQLQVWPAGYTTTWVKVGKAERLTPVEAAGWAMCELATRKVLDEAIDRPTGLRLCRVAYEEVRENSEPTGAFLERLQRYVDGAPLE